MANLLEHGECQRLAGRGGGVPPRNFAGARPGGFPPHPPSLAPARGAVRVRARILCDRSGTPGDAGTISAPKKVANAHWRIVSAPEKKAAAWRSICRPTPLDRFRENPPPGGAPAPKERLASVARRTDPLRRAPACIRYFDLTLL